MLFITFLTPKHVAGCIYITSAAFLTIYGLFSSQRLEFLIGMLYIRGLDTRIHTHLLDILIYYHFVFSCFTYHICYSSQLLTNGLVYILMITLSSYILISFSYSPQKSLHLKVRGFVLKWGFRLAYSWTYFSGILHWRVGFTLHSSRFQRWLDLLWSSQLPWFQWVNWPRMNRSWGGRPQINSLLPFWRDSGHNLSFLPFHRDLRADMVSLDCVILGFLVMPMLCSTNIEEVRGAFTTDFLGYFSVIIYMIYTLSDILFTRWKNSDEGVIDDTQHQYSQCIAHEHLESAAGIVLGDVCFDSRVFWCNR